MFLKLCADSGDSDRSAQDAHPNRLAKFFPICMINQCMLFCPNIHLKLPSALLVYRIIDSHVKRYLVSCVNCKDSDQAAKPRYPIRAFSVFIPGRNTLCTSSSWKSMLDQEKTHSIKSRFHSEVALSSMEANKKSQKPSLPLQNIGQWRFNLTPQVIHI